MRLELTRQLDGIYNEFGNNRGALKASALMGIRKPVLGWTTNETLREPDPDSFFQRHLYLGVYPTAPYPFNHHCITPEPAADGFSMDYGPLLDATRGKRWVLTARCVNAVTPGLGVNLFEVPGGYALTGHVRRQGRQGRSAGTSGPPEAELCDGPADEFVVVRAR